jgi:hypothetical protein
MSSNRNPSDDASNEGAEDGIRPIASPSLAPCAVLWPSVLEFVFRRLGRPLAFDELIEFLVIWVEGNAIGHGWLKPVSTILHDSPQFRRLEDGRWCLLQENAS